MIADRIIRIRKHKINKDGFEFLVLVREVTGEFESEKVIQKEIQHNKHANVI